MDHINSYNSQTSRLYYIDRPSFDRLSTTQKVMVLLLIRLQLINPRWAEYSSNLSMHHENISDMARRHLLSLYITFFRRLEMLYCDLAPNVTMDTGKMVKEQDEWILTLMAEPYRCLEQIRTVVEPRYRPLGLDLIVDSLRSHSNFELYYHFRGLFCELQYFRIRK